ncbi:MAG TPA: pseudomurein-binding protein [Methanobacterium sp.]|nr:pseudomurein-binding protein [Methanobacterium sp.]
MESLTLGQYRQMVEDVLDFKKVNGEMPDYTIINGCRIDKEEYIDMIERVNRFFLEIGRNPRMVEIERTKFTKTGKVLSH